MMVTSFTKYGSFFIKGIKDTILISSIGVILGSILGALIALMKLSKFKPLSWLQVYTLNS